MITFPYAFLRNKRIGKVSQKENVMEVNQKEKSAVMTKCLYCGADISKTAAIQKCPQCGTICPTLTRAQYAKKWLIQVGVGIVLAVILFFVVKHFFMSL
jgi:predicted RNA-binding Zn-ribbon protein involved in translation (DUF1610 family)